MAAFYSYFDFKIFAHMYEKLIRFLENNSKPIARSIPFSKHYHPYVTDAESLENTAELSTSDPLCMARFNYIKNLAVTEPKQFTVPDEIQSHEKALMYLSFQDFARAKLALRTPLRLEIIGATARGRTGSAANKLVAKLSNTHNVDEHPLEVDNYKFETFKIQPLTYDELLYIYIHILEIQKNEDNRTLRDSRVLAILERALCEINYPIEDVRLKNIQNTFRFLHSELANSAKEIEKILAGDLSLSWDSPILFRGQLEIQLARAYKAQFDGKEAYNLLRPYPLFNEKIDCLIASKQTEPAITEIESYINYILSSAASDRQNGLDREKKMIISDLYIKMAHLTGDLTHFDEAAKYFRTAKLHYAKAILLSKGNSNLEAMCEACLALDLSPDDADIGFFIGCLSMKEENYHRAIDMFKILKARDPTNENVSKNLSYCHYKLNEVDQTLSSLRDVALRDPAAMKNYLYLSARHERIENVDWVLRRIGNDRVLSDVINYLALAGKMKIEDIKAALEDNPNIDAEEIDRLMATLMAHSHLWGTMI